MLIASAAEQGSEAEPARRPAERQATAREKPKPAATARRAPAPREAASGPRGRWRVTVTMTEAGKPGVSMAPERKQGGRAVASSAKQEAPGPLPEVGPGLLAALDSAANAVGPQRQASPALLFAIAWRESRLDPAARNPASSARGLMQFTRATWLEVVRDHGPRHGLAPLAKALTTDPATGEISAPAEPAKLAEILEMRNDPRLSATLALERMEAEREGLRRAIRRQPQPADLYLVHLLGPTGARRFLAALNEGPSRPAAEAVAPEAVEANRNVFYDRDGTPVSLRGVHADITRTLQLQQRAYAAAVAKAGGRVEVAAAR